MLINWYNCFPFNQESLQQTNYQETLQGAVLKEYITVLE